ncbi:hypothetical protein B0J17DRAFT_767300 [Rhizoctonia solani]|nr:hypothetical protein B0J17DRAFT_767300 [Rhizoctonia solani]
MRASASFEVLVTLMAVASTVAPPIGATPGPSRPALRTGLLKHNSSVVPVSVSKLPRWTNPTVNTCDCKHISAESIKPIAIEVEMSEELQAKIHVPDAHSHIDIDVNKGKSQPKPQPKP